VAVEILLAATAFVVTFIPITAVEIRMALGKYTN